MKIVKIGECYVNLENVTHAEFETTPNGLVCTVFFNCEITDRNGSNGVQASKIFSSNAAREFKAWMDLRLKTLETDKM